MTLPNNYITAEDDMLSVNQERMKTAARRLYSKPTVSDQQISELMPLVNMIAHKVISYIRPPLTFDDLISAGMVGLVKAARDYNASFKAEFKTYASIRIRGAILDELKSWSFISDNARKKIREAMIVSHQMEMENGQTPDDEMLANEMGISIEELHQTLDAARVQQFISIDSATEEDTPLSALLTNANNCGPENNIEKQELMEKLAEAIQQLDQKQRQLVLLYYQQNLTMKQIAEVFDVTEARVSQLHSSAIFNLSVKLSEWRNG